MSSWRSTGLTLWALATIALSGCSSTSIPARLARIATGQVGPSESVPFDRLVSIGKTFEAQGNYDKAQRMYNMVLSRQPNNVDAGQSMRRLVALRRNNGRVFEGTGKPLLPAAPSMQRQQAVMMASAPQPQSSGITQVSNESFTSGGLRVAKPKSVQALTAASTVPYRSQPNKQTTKSEPELSVPPTEEEWTLPRVAPTPVFNNPEAGRVSMDTMAPAEPFVMPKTRSAPTVVAAPINIEACLDNPENHMTELTGALAAADPDVRSLAAFLLGEAGPSARPAINQLRSRLSTESSEPIRISVAEAIAKLDSSDEIAKSFMLKAIGSKDPSIRSQAAFAMRVFAESADQRTVSALESAVADPDQNVAAMAALSLSDFGAKAVSALPALTNARVGASQEVKDAVDAAIARIKG